MEAYTSTTPRHPSKWKRNAVFFIAGQFVSMFGSMLVSHAVTWHVTLNRQSGSLIALFTAAAMVPMVFAAPFAGVWADRYNRKYLINLSDAVIAVITLTIALLYRSGYQNIWLLLGAVTVRSLGQGVQSPAVSAIIPQIVPQEHLARFNGIQSTATSLTMFAAPMAAGALLSFLPIEMIFFIDVVTAVIGIGTVFFFVQVTGSVRLPEPSGAAAAGFPDQFQATAVWEQEMNATPVSAPAAGTGSSFLGEMKEGLSFINTQKWLKILLIALAGFMVLAAPAAMLTPLQVARTFGSDVWRLTAIEIAFSVGMMAGGIVISIWGGFRNKVHTMLLAWFFFSITTVAFGLVGNFWVYLGTMAFCGVFMPFFNTTSMTLMQTRIPPHLMGRVFSVFTIISGLGMPVGMMFFGPVSDLVRIELLLIITGVLMLAAGLLLTRSKELIQSGAL